MEIVLTFRVAPMHRRLFFKEMKSHLAALKRHNVSYDVVSDPNASVPTMHDERGVGYPALLRIKEAIASRVPLHRCCRCKRDMPNSYVYNCPLHGVSCENPICADCVEHNR